MSSRRRMCAGVMVLAGVGLASPPAQAAEPFDVAATIDVTYSSDIAVAGDYGYVASNSEISVLDGTSGSVVSTVSLTGVGGISSPRGVATSGGRVFFAAAGSNELLTLNIDSSSLNKISTNPSGNECTSPANLLVVSETRLVANCQGNNKIQVYDISGLPSIVGTYATGSGPRLMSSSGDFVFVPNHNAGQNSMSVINIASGATTTATVGQRPNATAYLNGKVYTADYGSSEVTISGGANFDQQLAQLNVGTSPQDIAACQGKIFTANRDSGNASVINPADNSVTTIPLGGVTTHVLGVKGNYVYFLNFGSNTVSAVDCRTETLVASVTVASNPSWIAFSDSYAYVTLAGNKVAAIAIPRESSDEGGSGAGVPGGTPTDTLTLTNTPDGVTCTNASVSGLQGTWITLPSADECSVTNEPDARLLGWATISDFPVSIAQRQVDNGWGAYELFNDDGRMTAVFIPAGRATFLSNSTTLFPVLSVPQSLAPTP